MSLPPRPAWPLLLLLSLLLSVPAWSARPHRSHTKSRKHRPHKQKRPVVRTAHPRPAVEPPPAGELPGGGIGWSDAPQQGWNAGEALLGPIRRIPLDGLRTISCDPAPLRRLPPLERADRRAIVLLHKDLDPEQPVDLLLHLHGYDPGYRQPLSAGRGEPVRDRDLDRFAEQMAGSGNVQLITLLPQGGATAGFSPTPGRKTFDAMALLDEVLERLHVTRLLSARPPVRRLLVSAHSGGGETLGIMLAEEHQLRTAAAVTLFDGINGAREELPRILRWLRGRLAQDLAELHDKDPADQQAYLQHSLRFRAYFTERSRLYPPLHGELSLFFDAWFREHEAALGGPRSPAYRGLRENYQVLPVPQATHNEMIGTGLLREALSALPDPDQTSPQTQS